MYPHYHTHISTSSNTCIHFIEYVYSHHRTRISLPHYVGIYIYAGTINRPLQLLTACNNAADDLQQRCERFTNNVTPTHEMPTKHSARRRGRFIVPVSLHNQIRIFTSSNTCFRFTAHAYPHYRIRVFTLLNTHFHITAHAFPFVILWVYTYMRAR